MLGHPEKEYTTNLSANYRKDIDGIRAIAILSVILFHFGCLPNGYLGVDIFFVISGYLITKIIFKETLENRFSIIHFYIRRIRRIIPLVLFTTSIALIIGLIVMIPDDLENLSQSVISTNFFANNILLYLTSGNYWNIVNEYKPLMHTWSLGIEEQYYLFYPLFFLIFQGKKIRYILPTLIFLTILSLLLYFINTNEAAKFYLIPFRFFELSIGGIGAIYLKKFKNATRLKFVLLLGLISILFFSIDLPDNIKLLLSILITLCILLSESNNKTINYYILENKLMVGIGKISFSLYMWHQIILAFTRYFVLERINSFQYILIFIATLILSVFSYYFIEQPFRKDKIIGTKKLLWIVCSVFLLTTSVSFYIYFKAGVIRDVPELDLYTSNVQRNIHTKYNSRIYEFDKNFSKNKNIKVIVIGDSFARDWANILLESKFKKEIEISYISDIAKCNQLKERFREVKFIFISATIIDMSQYNILVKNLNLNSANIWIIGTKNFGINNGYFYNNRHNPDYFRQRTSMSDGYAEENELMKKQWGVKYIDMIQKVIDKNGTVAIFTPNGKFISEDCRHLTRNGSIYYSQLLESKLVSIFSN